MAGLSLPQERALDLSIREIDLLVIELYRIGSINPRATLLRGEALEMILRDNQMASHWTTALVLRDLEGAFLNRTRQPERERERSVTSTCRAREPRLL